jgi:hypothetical protein
MALRALRRQRQWSDAFVRAWKHGPEGDVPGVRTASSALRTWMDGQGSTPCGHEEQPRTCSLRKHSRWRYPQSSSHVTLPATFFPPTARPFSSTGGTESSDGDAKALLQSLRAVDFLPHLMELKKTKRVITHDDLVAEFHRALPLASDEDARRIVDAMANSGLLLASGDVIYLDPGEIAKTLRTVLPIDAPVMRERLVQVEEALRPMDALKDRIESKARRKSMLVNGLFLGFLSLQWGVFLRLCYYELSWDVVEPLGFFAGGLTTILSFAWAIMTQRNFSYEALSSQVNNRWVYKELEKRGFDFLTYDRLTREKQRLEESLRLCTAMGDETRHLDAVLR